MGIGVLFGVGTKILNMGFDPMTDISVIMGGVGLLVAKDQNVTGGTVQQYPTLKKTTSDTVIQDPNK